MISCWEKLVTDGRTNELTNDSESIGPTSKVGGSKNEYFGKKTGGGVKIHGSNRVLQNPVFWGFSKKRTPPPQVLPW